MVRKQVKALTVLYLVPCQHFGVYFAPYQILLLMGAHAAAGEVSCLVSNMAAKKLNCYRCVNLSVTTGVVPPPLARGGYAEKLFL